MRGWKLSGGTYDGRAFARTGALALAALVLGSGCYAKMSHRGVANPIFLGERMHIGEGPRFELAEEREKYRAQSLNMYLWALLPTGNEVSDRDQKAAVSRQAKRRLGFSSYRAVRTKGVEVGSSSLFFFVFLAIGSSVEFYGELVEVVPPAEEQEPGS
jgi:hypothetical protein